MGAQHSSLQRSSSIMRRSPSIKSIKSNNTLSLNSTNNTLSLLMRHEWDLAIQRLQQCPREAQRAGAALHVACTSPEVPLDVVQALVQADPSSLSRCCSSAQYYSEECSSGSGATATTPVQQQQRPRLSSIGEETISSSTSSGSSSSTEESGGWLPLHVAVANGCSLNVIQWLLQEYPTAVMCKNASGFLPLHLAIMHQE